MARPLSTIAGIAVATAAVLAGCQARTTTTVERSFTVSGPPDAVETFVQAQATRSPELQPSPLKMIDQDTAEIEIAVGDDFTGDDVVQTSRDAIAAGLTHSFTDSRTTR